MHDDLKTLVQQMPIADSELQERKELLGLTRDGEEALVKLRYLALRSVDAIVAKFYDQQLAVPEINSIIGVGKVHARIGVPPKLYVASLHLLESLIVERMLAQADALTAQAMRKLFLLDLQFAFDAYANGAVSKVELARSTAERYSRSLEPVIETRTPMFARRPKPTRCRACSAARPLTACRHGKPRLRLRPMANCRLPYWISTASS